MHHDDERLAKRLQRFVVQTLNKWLASSAGIATFCVVLLVMSGSSVMFALHSLPGVDSWFYPSQHALKYAPVCASTDNIAETSFGMQRCAEPIDVVYTWVNGSDPIWYKAMSEYKRKELLRRKYGENWEQVQEAIAPEETGVNARTGSANRYRDNNELKYSLRSLVKYAPWVRRIFIVTANQVPSWLNLADDRVRIITHDMIFRNKSHLPTFSSPAIEANIHHIPGLSNRFIYFNDDVFLGAPTMPDDFFTSVGQKVFWAWDAPRCNDGCLETWLGDGSCDVQCNISRCDWDAGECLGVAPTKTASTQTSSSFQTAATHKYCSTGCAQSWLGDNVCDNKCDNLLCGFDAIDCGVDVLWTSLQGFNFGSQNPAGFTQLHMPFVRSVLVSHSGKVEINASVNSISAYNRRSSTEAPAANESWVDGSNTSLSPLSDQPFVVTNSTAPPTATVVTIVEHQQTTQAPSTTGTANESDVVVNEMSDDERPTIDSQVLISIPHTESAVYFNLSSHFPLGNSTIQEAFHWNEPDHNMCPDRVEDDIIAAVLSQHYKVLTVVFDTASPNADCVDGHSLIHFTVRGVVDREVVDAAALFLGEADVQVLKESESSSEQNEVVLNLHFVVQRFFDGAALIEESPVTTMSAVTEESPSLQIQGNAAQCSFSSTKNAVTLAVNVSNATDFCSSAKLTAFAVHDGEDTSTPANASTSHQLRKQCHQTTLRKCWNRCGLDNSTKLDKAFSFGQVLAETGTSTTRPVGNSVHPQVTPTIPIATPMATTSSNAIAVTMHADNKTANSSHISPDEAAITASQHGRQEALITLTASSMGSCCCHQPPPTSTSELASNLTENSTHPLANTSLSNSTALSSRSDERATPNNGRSWWATFTLSTHQEQDPDHGDASGGDNSEEGEENSGSEDDEPPTDHYKHSLIKVNMLYNRAFGNKKRKVPAHMPHMLQKSQLAALHDRYPREFAATSSHRFRHSDDMQFAFAYFHWLVHNQYIGGQNDVDFTKLTNYWERELDTDQDGVINDNEFISVVGVALGHSPSEDELKNFRNCVAPPSTFTTMWARGDADLHATISSKPHITLPRLVNCSDFIEGVAKHARPNLGEGVSEGDIDEVGFHMISDDTEETMEKLNNIRSRRPKFVCVNDDMENPSDELLRHLQSFYQSFFPFPSRFELPRGQQNPAPLQYTALAPKVAADSTWQSTLRFLIIFSIIAIVVSLVRELRR